MAERAVQINARVAASTKRRLERLCQARGLKQEALVEDALLHHLSALDELPADLILRPRLVVDAPTAEAMAQQWEDPQPTEALKALVQGFGL